jgi:tol-pal system protein YbgF
MKLRILLPVGLLVFCGQAFAGLFSDDDARLQIQQVGTRVSKLEEADKKQADTNTQQAEINKKETSTLVDLQSQIESMSTDLRNLRGQNEELVHKLQDADKRQKDYYIDLDTRVRHFETTETQLGSGAPIVEGDRAYEAAQGLFNVGKFQDSIGAFQEFIKQFPDSVYVPNANFAIGDAYSALKDYQKALASYQVLTTKYAYSPKISDAMLAIVNCDLALKNTAAAKKVLNQLLAKYPGSPAASDAKKRFAKFIK